MQGLSPFDPLTVVLLAALNPVVVLVAFAMGRAADQWQKILIAAFAASLAGFLMFWLVTNFRVISIKGFGGEAGIVMAQFAFGLVWAAIGYLSKRTRRQRAGSQE